MLSITKISLFAGLILLTGCATTPSSTTVGKAANKRDAVPTAMQPAVSLTVRGDSLSGDFPPHILYQLLVAEVAAQRGRLDVAVSNYLSAAKALRDGNVAKRATQMAVFARALREALEAGQLWVEIEPDNAEAHKIVAPLLLAFGRAPEAVIHFQRLIELSADIPGHGLTQIATQLSRERNQVAAMSVMEQLTASHTDDAYAWLAQGQLALRQKGFEQALKSADQALVLHAHWVPAVILRSQVLVAQDERDAALEFLAREREGKLAKDSTVGLHYARLLAESGKLEEARKEFDVLSRQQPDNADMHYAAGILALQFKDLDEAEHRFKQVLSLRQRVQESIYHLGRVFEEKDDYQQAIEHYLSVRANGYYLDAQLRVANLMAKQGNLDDAIGHLHSVQVRGQEQQQRLYLLEGDLLRDAGKHQQALEFYTEKLAIDPENNSLRYARALLAEKMDKLAIAEQDLRTIIERDPANAQALNALGYTLADRTNRFDEALNLIQRALVLEPDDGVVIDSLGWVQYRLGNLTKAEEYLRRALDLIADPEVAAHLGEVLWMMGNKKDAMKVWEESLTEHPDHETLRKVMHRFGL